jgi:hypothetical protein
MTKHVTFAPVESGVERFPGVMKSGSRSGKQRKRTIKNRKRTPKGSNERAALQAAAEGARVRAEELREAPNVRRGQRAANHAASVAQRKAAQRKAAQSRKNE